MNPQVTILWTAPGWPFPRNACEGRTGGRALSSVLGWLCCPRREPAPVDFHPRALLKPVPSLLSLLTRPHALRLTLSQCDYERAVCALSSSNTRGFWKGLRTPSNPDPPFCSWRKWAPGDCNDFPREYSEWQCPRLQFFSPPSQFPALSPVLVQMENWV